jgi:hypothetical protein
MSVEIDPNMPGLNEASQQLDALIAADAAQSQGADGRPQGPAGQSATPEQRAAQGNVTDAQSPVSQQNDTPATAEGASALPPDAKHNDSTEGTKTGEIPLTQPSPKGRGQPAKDAGAQAADKPAAGQGAEGAEAGLEGKSRYAKARERLEKTWTSVNARKAELDSQAAALDQQRAEVVRQRAELDAIKRQAEQPQHAPEDILRASQQKRRDADALRMQAKRAEDAGNLQEQARLTKLADRAEMTADDLAQWAEQVRRNPPAGFAERAAQFEQQRKSWTLEAAKAFPDLVQQNSPFQQTVAGHLNALARQDPALLAHPSVIYHVCRLTAAEAAARQHQAQSQAAAARVSSLEKELGELKAKVKEYETLTAPGGSTTVAKLGGPSAGDEEAELERMAREMVMLR